MGSTSQRDGRGIFVVAKQRLFVGHWKKGEAHGPFTMIFPDGAMQKGSYRNGEYHGKVTLTLPDGSEQQFKYEDGKVIS